MTENFDKPRDEQAHPATIKAADGKTDLCRFRVDAVMYAGSREQVMRYLEDDLPMYGVAAAHVTGPDGEGLVAHTQRWTITVGNEPNEFAFDVRIPNTYEAELGLGALLEDSSCEGYCTYEDYAPPLKKES